MQRQEDHSMSLDTPVLSPVAAPAAPEDGSPHRSLTAADLLGRVVAARDLDQARFTPLSWLWHGYLGPGQVTLLTSQPKSGKTTLVSLLLARMQQGGQLAGLSVAAGKALVISEESEAVWQRRFQHLGIHDHVDLLCRPFTATPTMEQWRALVETALDLHQRHGTTLVVIDSLATFLPAHSENSAGALLECLTPLQRLTTAGMGVLLPHHPRKGNTLAGQAARGSGALPGFVDIIVEMGYYVAPDDLDRRRRLIAFSRHEETPRHLLMELVPDGSDYVVLQSGLEAALGESWPGVMHVLREEWHKRTRQEILELWPADYPKPESTTLWRWLSRAVLQGIIRQEGTGRTRDPFRYWLPEREPLMFPEGGSREEIQAWNDRHVAELLDLKSIPVPEMPASPDEAPPATPAAPAAEAQLSPPEPVPPPSPGPETVPSAAPAPDVPPAEAEAPVVLPFPWSMVDPSEVPKEVWDKARAAQRNRG
jgi:hypothetical protein